MTHIPVLLREVMKSLAPQPGQVIVDATFGRGGYSRAILATGASVIGIDRDPEAIEVGHALAAAEPRFKMLKGSFGMVDEVLHAANVNAVDGMVFDIGVSSPQIDDAARGFSFRMDGPLDMRMDPTQGESAADLVNNADENVLAQLILTYGEERRARAIARAIVTARATAPITRTHQLTEIIRRVVRPSRDGIDPSTRTFQGLRIAVNDELGELEQGLRAAERLLKPEGHLVVVSFHSLEDRIVKDFLRVRSGNAPQPSRHMPLGEAVVPSFTLLNNKPLTAADDELQQNPRARSARLRAAIRTAAPAMKEAA